jgi:hypothetical protein
MRYYSFVETADNPEGHRVVTMSEDEIRAEYYPYWLTRMHAKYGEAVVQERYSFEDCLDDWIVSHWAWEVKEP